MLINTLPFKYAMLSTKDHNGNACLFSTVMLLSKEGFFSLTLNTILGPSQIFWESTV